MPEILTVAELATLLKMSRSQIFELTRERVRVRMKHPLPVMRVNGNLRFSKSAVMDWLAKLQEGSVQ